MINLRKSTDTKRLTREQLIRILWAHINRLEEAIQVLQDPEVRADEKGLIYIEWLTLRLDDPDYDLDFENYLNRYYNAIG